MLSVTRLICGTTTPGDALRYGRDSRKSPAHLLHFSKDKRPIVVWNITRRCNLSCVHCYADSHDEHYPGELSTAECKQIIDQLAAFEVPTILFSGGEPLLRPDLFELIAYVRSKKIRTVLSTNGTQITPLVARKLKELDMAYVGISIDGLRSTHDRHRGHKGAFDEALRGIRYCKEAGLRVGLRFTVSQLNVHELPAVLDLMETEDIPRCCVYHLAYAGRGDRISGKDLTHAETRGAVTAIFDKAQYFHRKGLDKDILTVDNHTDNVYLYLRLRETEPERAEEVYQMLKWNGGNQSGIAIACIDWFGNVHPDQFSMHITFGNVKERPFRDIWLDTSNPLIAKLKDRKDHVKGRCAACRYFEICNGNLRVRAESATGDPWESDPACYLTDEEIGVAYASSGSKEQNGSSAK